MKQPANAQRTGNCHGKFGLKGLLCWSCASALSLLLCSTSLHATLVFDNLTGSTSSGGVNSGQWVAQSFTVDNNSYSSLSVVLNVPLIFDTSGGFFVRLYDSLGTGQRPGNSLLTLTGSDNPNIGHNTYTGTASLAANTSYFIVAGVDSGSGFYSWSWEGPADGVTGSTIGYCYGLTDGGVSWTSLSDNGTFLMEVSAVPEPGQWAAILASIMCAGGMMAKARSRKQAT